MRRAVRQPGRTPAGRPAGKRPTGLGRSPARKPVRRSGRQRALRPFDGRTAVFVAGSPSLHRFIASRLSNRTDIWVAKPLSARDHAKGTVFRMKPDVTVVDLDPVWNPAGLPLARDVAEACPAAHVVLIAPEGYSQGQMISAASRDAAWSVVLRRRNDTGENLMTAIVAGLSGGSWIDPDLTEPGDGRAAADGESTVAEEQRLWEEGLAADALESAGSVGSLTEGSVADEEAEGWRERARRGIGH